MVVDWNRERDDFQVQSFCNLTTYFTLQHQRKCLKSVGFVALQFWELCLL